MPIIRKFSVRLASITGWSLCTRITEIDGITGCSFSATKDPEFLTFAVEMNDSSDPWFLGMRIGMLAIEYINKQKFGIEINSDLKAPGDTSGWNVPNL